MKRTWIAFAVAAALPLTALAQMGSPSAPPKSPGSSDSGPGMAKDSPLNRLDTNKDGFVSKNEAKGSAEVSKNFSTLDKDHDGKLSPSELSGASGASSGSSGSDSKSGGMSPGTGSSPKSKY
jgi:EF hand domain-containing protein